MSDKITIEFFHDAMSCWAYPLSPRLRNLVAKHPEVEVVHRSWVLIWAPEEQEKIFKTKAAAKEEIVMLHWAEARRIEPDDRIQCEKMMAQPFDYPYSIPNLLASKAAERQAGHAGHWDYFDRIQKAHLTECRNIADTAVLRDCAKDIGLDVARWEKDFTDDATRKMMMDDVARARQFGLMRTPALLANGKYQLNGHPKSTFGATISTEVLDIFYADIKRQAERGG